jgi:hypothetical protein
MPKTITDADPPALWHEVRQCELAIWRGTGWDTPGAGGTLRDHGFRPLDECPDGLVVQPLPVWQLPPGPPPNADEPFRQAYTCARRASRMLADRGDLRAAAGLLAEANRLLDPDSGPEQLSDVPSAVAGWFGRPEPSLLFRTVELLRTAAVRPAGDASPEATAPGPAVEFGSGGWADAFTPPAVAAALRDHRTDLRLLALADEADWPGMRYLRRTVEGHPLGGDARYLSHLLTTATSMDELAANPRPELIPGQVPGTGDDDITMSVLRWGLIGPDLLRPSAVRPNPSTAAVAVIDAVARLTRISHDLHAPATIREVLGPLPIGAQP